LTVYPKRAKNKYQHLVYNYVKDDQNLVFNNKNVKVYFMK